MSLALLCPGQGAQDPRILAALSAEPDARAVVAAFERATGIAVSDLPELAPERLQANALAQPLVCATALASFAVLRSRLPEPSIFAGYSVGELAAYGCAGWLTAEETIGLSVLRAAAMDAASAVPAAMAAIRGLLRADLDGLLSGRAAHVAIVNGADRFVVGGEAAIIAAVARDAVERGAVATPLAVRVASHTPTLEPAMAPFRAALEASGLRPGATVLAGIDGTPVLSRARAIETLCTQIARTVRWDACMRGLVEAGASLAIELPAGADLSKLVREAEPTLIVRAASEFRTPDGLANWVARQLA